MALDPDHSAAAGGSGGGDLMERAVDGAIRLGRAWKTLTRERRLAAVAAAVLWITLFLPWYQASVVSRNGRTRNAIPVSESLSGWAAFGLVQALLLILSLGILVVLFLRAEGRIAHLPGGDGWTVTAVGGFSAFLIVLGLFSAPTPATHGQYTVSTGLDWGIFLALIAAAALTWAGGRIRSSLEDDPFLAGNRRSTGPSAAGAEPPAPAPPQPRERAPAPVRAPTPGEPAAAEATAPAPGTTPEVVEEPTGVTKVGEPLTAAAATHSAETADDPHERATEPRSPWRPAERPDWTDPERPMGWLTAPPKHGRSEDETD